MFVSIDCSRAIRAKALQADLLPDRSYERNRTSYSLISSPATAVLCRGVGSDMRVEAGTPGSCTDTSIPAKSAGIPCPWAPLPSQYTSRIPSDWDSTGLDGTGGGSPSVAVWMRKGADQAPVESLVVALTLNMYVVSTSRSGMATEGESAAGMVTDPAPFTLYRGSSHEIS